MESFLSSRSLGEESLQMWDLNKRLEAYLARVKFLEEENELLKAEIQGLKGGSAENSWRAKYEEEVAALRATLDQAYQEKCMVELARDSLYEEVQQVKSRCQRERAAHEEAKMFLSISKKEMEEEKRTHIWLREKATQLEKEIEALVEAHQEELLGLDQEMASFSQSFDSFRVGPVCFQPVEVEDYAKRLSNIWKGAVETYKMEVSQLEASLCEAKENLWKATERNRQNQLQLQQLEKELASLKVRKKSLEDSLSQQWAQQQGDAEKLQMAMEALEEEKQSLRGQISHVLEDRQQLMHLKMSLSLEVATYRTLLEAESTRLQMPGAEFQLARGLRDVTTEATQGKLQGLPTDRGRSGSRDVWPSPVAFPKGAPKLRGFQSKAESLSASLGPLGAKNHGSTAREFQKANTALRHSQPTESIEGPLPPKEPSAFSLDSSQQSQKVTHIESMAQSVFHTHTEPLGKREVLNGPFPSQMVTEALETAIQEVNRKEAHLEPSLLNAVKSQADDSLGRPSSLEEENKDAVPLSTEVLEMAQEDRTGEGQPTDLLEDLQACEDFAEVNGGQEAWAELQGTEEAWPALGAEAPLPLGAELPRVERIVEDVAVLVTGEKETYEETGSPEWKESDTDEELPTLLGMALGNDLGEAPKHPESATEAPTNESSNQEGWERGSPQPDVLGGASEVNMEEVYGEAEDVEMVSTEDLLPEETREPWSPPRENNQSDLQAELLRMEQLQLEGSSAREDWSPTIHTALSAGEPQKPLFLEGEQEKFESQEELLHETDSALPEQENEEKGLDSEVFCVEDALPRSSAIDEDGTLADEPKAIKSREITEEDEEKAREEVFKSESLLRDDMGDEGTVERESYLDLEEPKSTLELGVTLPGEDVASLQVQETHQEEQRTEVPEEQPLEEQKEGGGGLSEVLLQAEGRDLKERDLMTASEAPESEEVTDALEMEEVSSTIMTENLLQKKENALECSEDKEFGLDNHQAGEQPAVAEGPWTEQTTCPEEDQELGSPPEPKGPAADLISQREDSGPEEILEHLESSPNSNNERDGTEEEHVILLEETLPDHTALHVYHGQVLAMTETSSVPFLEREEMPLLAQEDEPPISEEDSTSILLAKEYGMEEGAPKEERGCSPQALPEEDRPCSEEPLAAEGLAEAVIQTSPFMGEKDDQGMVEAEVTREEEHKELEVVPGREPEEDPWQEGNVEKGSEVPKEEVDSELALELEEHCVFQADGFDPSYTQQEEEEEEEEGPLEISNQDPTDVAPTKVSPLTSVADLGEIVLEGEGSSSGPKGAVESDVLVSCEDECFHVSDPEDLIQHKIMAVEDPSGTGFPKTFPEEVVGLSLESRRDHDILEIVEQALEFNQELIKAAGDELGALGKDAQHSPEERSLHVPPASLDQGQPQVSTEALKSSSPMTSSPKQIHPLVESNANGLQEEPSLEEFTSELLNGIGQDKTDSSGDGFIKEVTITPQFCTEGLDNFPMAETVSQSPPPMPASEKGFRSGDVSPEVLEKVSLDEEGLETLDENILDDLRQKTCVKGGKDTELEAMPFLFGDEIRRQPLEFRPEGDMDLQSSEDN